MSTDHSADQFVKTLEAHRSPEEAQKIQRYFKHGEGDGFMGVRMGQVFTLAKVFIDMPPSEIEKLLESPIHEVRAGALSIMDQHAATMPRVALRYAIEHLDQEQRDQYLRMKKAG